MKVKSCWLIEGGMAYRPNWIGGCCTSTAVAPFFYEGASLDEIKKGRIPSLNEIIKKRMELFQKANDPNSGIPCLKCNYLVEKDITKVSFDKLDYVDIQHYTMCNNRCTYCCYTHQNLFVKPQYDLLEHLETFAKSHKIADNCLVLFNGGEPALLKDFNRYIQYFQKHGMQVELYTNGTIFNEDIFKSISSGDIIRTNISIDAGTALTYKKIHGSDSFDKIIENIARYSKASEQSGAQIQAKYIFTEENCSDDDIRGFVFAMLAVRPQRILLTVNFEHLGIHPSDTPETIRDHDYSLEIEGFARIHVLFANYGWQVNHLMHYITIVDQGKKLYEKILSRIRELETLSPPDPRTFLKTFRKRRPSQILIDKCLPLLPEGTRRRQVAQKTWLWLQGRVRKFRRR